ncbi:APC family permease [Xanthomonas campestris pv. campestris]|uniref:APC family permease n=1 Tax=Xanthomonas campestris TaxID=339 RepID=UPI001C8423F1|nr:APC family permease [Xanthomonas campestris]MDM7668786.1 APC family permease [Xanthomonas campestris pv. campestris]MDM7689724.1 APC family permease [Xanthomonas campestris pv. campestris]MDM7837407.1 APC family permease [Xanthomonas campestris pv. campestris]MDM7872987.1 APC family permease [Xanthomonas campestris pv. campestris]
MTTHGASAQGKFHKRLSLTDLTFIGLGSIFGSGWLFSASHVSSIAGPAGIVSWILGGIAVLLLGLVYCELGAALPRAGGVVRYPEYSHGPLLGSLTGFITLIAFSSLIAIEVEAARQYAAAWFPALSQAGSTHPSLLGWLVQLALLLLFFALNYFSVKTFALANNIVSVFKFLVPILVIVLLMKHFNADNLSVHGFAPSGMAGVEAAISAGGIIFAYLGLTPIVSVASEVRNPQRNIPIALILSVALSTVIYVLLQLAFLGSIPAAQLAQGWSGIDKAFSLPYHDIALALGMAWLAALVICDAMVSPSGTGNIYMNATPRVVYGWARSGGFLPVLTRVDPASGIPRPALWLSLGLSIFWTLPFPSWETLIGVVSAALVLSYAVAPVTVAALIVYWSTWPTLSWLLGLQVLAFAAYVLYRLPSRACRARLLRQVRASLWLIVFFVLVMAVSWAGTFGGHGWIAHPFDTLSVAVIAFGIYHWGARSGLRSDELALEEDDGE